MTDAPKDLPSDPLAKTGFWLAVIIFFFPTHADVVFVAVLEAIDILPMFLFSACCLGVVAVPAILSARRVFSSEPKYSGRAYLIATFVLLAWGFLGACAAIYARFTQPT